MDANLNMIKYIGIKRISAKPMTRGDYNIFKGWTLPEGENPNDEGYLVQYSDDYTSWSPKETFDKSHTALTDVISLVETSEMMASKDYKERFRAEYFQLTIRIDGLNKMLEKYKAGTLPFTPTCSYEVLDLQLYSMLIYKNVLVKRAEIEKIDLE